MGLQEVDSVSKELVEKQFHKKMEQNLQPDEQKLLYEAYDCLKVKQCLEQYNKYGYFLKQAEQISQQVEEIKDIRICIPIIYYVSFCMFATTVFKNSPEQKQAGRMGILLAVIFAMNELGQLG